MKKYYVLLSVFLFQSVFCQHSVVEWKLSVSIFDENRMPVSEVECGLSYYARENGKWVRKNVLKKADEKGQINIDMEALNVFSIGVAKEGYYPVILKPELERVDDSWVPVHDTFDIVLQKKQEGRPLFAKMLSYEKKKTFLPHKDKETGYDLLVGDWVKPFGNGEVADLFFQARTLDSGKVDILPGVQYKVFTKGEGNGLIQVNDAFGDLPYEVKNLKLGQMAPQEGYANQFEFVHALGMSIEELKGFLKDTAWDGKSNTDKADGYWLRIRSKIDPETGKVISAYYGKIISPIRIRPDRNGNLYLSFNYLVSPEPNNNSIVWDRKTTLIPGYTLPPAGARYH